MSQKYTKKKVEQMEKDKNKIYNKPLIEAFPHLKAKAQTGEIGIEIECEGMNLFSTPISWWQTHTDNSLRAYKGHPPIEYVLRKPISRGDVPKALTYLTKKLNEVGSDVQNSHRTSVHIHVNCQKLTFKQVIQFWGLYAILEELLVEFSGPDRVGNLFCLRAKDAQHFVQILEQGLQLSEYDEIFSKDLRYTACNMASLNKFGSIEFRSMRGTVDQGIIQLWIDILLWIRDKALEYDDPQAIVKDFEKFGPEMFFKKIVLRDDIYTLLTSFPDYKSKAWDGLRLMRDVAYAITWDKRDESLVEKKDSDENPKQDQENQSQTQVLHQVNPSQSQNPSGEMEPIYLQEGVFIQFNHEGSWVFNYNKSYAAVYIRGDHWGLAQRKKYKVNLLTGKYEGEGYNLHPLEMPPTNYVFDPSLPFKLNSDGSYDAPPAPEEPEVNILVEEPEPEPEPDFETEINNEDDDDF